MINLDENRRAAWHTAAEDDPILSVTHLATSFKTSAGTVRALDDVSFTVGRGETLGIVGESGSGKTVLLRSVFGLLPKAGVQRRGEVWFEGVDLVALPEKSLRRYWGSKIAMIFQDPLTSLNPVKPIGRQITEGILFHNEMSRREANDRAISLLAEVGLPDPATRMKDFPHHLSGGMRQRVMIAIALSGDPELLCADEPTTALDVTVQAQILDLLSKLQNERGMSMILVTHDLGVVAGRTDNIAVMYAGRIVEKAPTKSLFSRIRMPYTQGLVESIPKLENPSHTRLSVIPGRPPDPTRFPTGCRFHPRCGFAGQTCIDAMPELQAASDSSHLFACWHPLGGQQVVDHGRVRS